MSIQIIFRCCFLSYDLFFLKFERVEFLIALHAVLNVEISYQCRCVCGGKRICSISFLWKIGKSRVDRGVGRPCTIYLNSAFD